MPTPKPGHGDHWLAALDAADPRLAGALAFPADAPERVKLHRKPLTGALDLVQVTAKRRLVTAYPEPRATALVALKPRELHLWDTGVEAWLVAEHAGAGTLTIFLSDLVERAADYQAAKGSIGLELAGLAYTMGRSPAILGPPRLKPGRERDERFLPDDYWFDGEVRGTQPTDEGMVLDLEFQGSLAFPVVARDAIPQGPGGRVQGFLWLTGRLPQGH